MTAYYNEFDPFAAQWLRELINRGLIAPGVVDERSIEDVRPADLAGYTQCHFFAGIGVWSYALRLAGWPDNRPVWTASCPCQPFSQAGQELGFNDERHLWPHLHWLIGERKPSIVIGEQVASKAAEPWFDLVQADLEELDYAFGLVPFPSAGVGAPHIRDRAYWVGNASGEGSQGHAGHDCEARRKGAARPAAAAGVSGGLADADSDRRGERSKAAKASGHGNSIGTAGSDDRHNPDGPVNGFWKNADWLLCRDGKWRPVESAFKQMVDGLTCAMVYLRDVCGRKEKIEEVIYAATADSNSYEILRAMRDGAAPEAVWLQIGGQVGFYEATLLFAFLLEFEGKLGRFLDCAAQRGAKACERLLREVWKNGLSSRSPHRRGYTQQPARKFADALSELPQTGALEVLKTLNGGPLVDGAPARVGRLRGYGNAINAEAARAFIETLNNCIRS